MTLQEDLAHKAKVNPNAPLYAFAEPDPSTEIVTITSLEFCRATHRAAWTLRSQFQGSDGDVVAVIAQADSIVYYAIVLGLMTANLTVSLRSWFLVFHRRFTCGQPFPICPRLHAPAVAQLLRKTHCHRVIATQTTLEPLIREIHTEIQAIDPTFVITFEEAPALAHLYPNLGHENENAATAFEAYVSNRKPNLDDLCLYLHSSGSTTGFPKPTPHTHRILLHWSRLGAFFALVSSGIFLLTQIPSAFVSEIHNFVRPQCYMGTFGVQTYALSGTICQILWPLYGDVAVAVYPPTATSPNMLPILPSPANILHYAQKMPCDSIATLSSLLSAWSRSPDAIAYLKTSKLVVRTLFICLPTLCLTFT